MARTIRGFPNYKISKLGVVTNIKGNILKTKNNPGGYVVIILYNKRGRFTRYIHRLVGLHFVDNSLNLPEINHEDGNKLNNNWGNLKWCTHQYNIEHSNRTGLAPSMKGEAHYNRKL